MSGGEDRITGWFAAQSKASAERFPIGIGDDMAQVRAEAGSVLVTTDMLLDGVHFDLVTVSIEQVGYKAMAASLSDCAAMASVPVCAVVSVALPVGWSGEELKKLHAGIVRAGGMFGCELIGGDITAWKEKKGRFAVSVSMLSRPGDSAPVRRDGAKVGDAICVTGRLGGSLAGKHLEFVPRVEEALGLTAMAEVHAMMDITDGLSVDLGRMCRASGVGAMIEVDDVPIADAAMGRDDPLGAAMNDGEDFELLFTLSDEAWEKAAAGWKFSVEICRVGTVVEGKGVQVRYGDGRVEELTGGGYDHLA